MITSDYPNCKTRPQQIKTVFPNPGAVHVFEKGLFTNSKGLFFYDYSNSSGKNIYIKKPNNEN